MKLNIKTTIFIITALIVTFYVYAFFPQSPESEAVYSAQDVIAYAGLEDELEDVQKKLGDVRLKKQNLQSIINSEAAKQSEFGSEIAILTAEINLKNAEIEEIQLDIEKISLEIEILEYNMGVTEDNIVEKEEVIEKLEHETNDRLVSMYLTKKSYNSVSIVLDSQTSMEFVKNDLYQRTIQEDTNDDLQSLNTEREQLQKEKEQLENDKLQVEKDKSVLDERKSALDNEKLVLDTKKVSLDKKVKESLSLQKQQELALQQSTVEEKKLLADAEYLKQQILEEIGTIPTGSYVRKGTIIGIEGMTGWATGPHVHFGVANNGTTQNPCNFVNCGAKTGSQLGWPIAPAGVITSGYGYRSSGFHAAIDISTGGGAGIIAAHDGWITYGKQFCQDLSWVKCNGGFAYYAIICENASNCNSGFKTSYWHLKYQ